MGATTSLAFFSAHNSCQGTMFEWCSIAVRSTSSPSPTRCLPKVCATRLMPSVVPRTKTISLGQLVPRKVATFWRAAS